MAFPKVSVIFKGIAANAVKRGDRGIVALILKDTAVGLSLIHISEPTRRNLVSRMPSSA